LLLPSLNFPDHSRASRGEVERVLDAAGYLGHFTIDFASGKVVQVPREGSD
jgi:hypothetical protein